MIFKIGASWENVLKDELGQDYMKNLCDFVQKERLDYEIYPPSSLVFKAFELTPFDDVKVVVLGQDPYHQPGQAHGLAFSVPIGVKIPPSLRNIYKELGRDIPGFMLPSHGDLIYWAQQGVLLLNATLTVRANQAGSHQKKGWEKLTDHIISTLSEEKSDLVFMLWGNYAQEKVKLIDETKHLILKSTHPSPLSAYQGFLGCGHFSKANQFLESKGLKIIDWQID